MCFINDTNTLQNDSKKWFNKSDWLPRQIPVLMMRIYQSLVTANPATIAVLIKTPAPMNAVSLEYPSNNPSQRKRSLVRGHPSAVSPDCLGSTSTSVISMQNWMYCHKHPELKDWRFGSPCFFIMEVDSEMWIWFNDKQYLSTCKQACNCSL